MRKTFTLAALTTLAVGLGACGGVDDRTDDVSTLAQLQGVVSDPNNVGVRNELRLALVWFNDYDPSLFDGETIDDSFFDLFVASDELTISPSFPAGFTLNLTAPPPPEVIGELLRVPGINNEGDEYLPPLVNVRNAQGVIVVYHDRNGNGRFDIVAPDATEFLDDVVGMAPRALVTWLEGDLPAELTPPGTQGQPKAGYNVILSPNDLVRAEVYGPFSYRLDYGVNLLAGPFDWRSPDEPLNVEISDAPALDTIMCPTMLGDVGAGCIDMVMRDVGPPYTPT